MPLGRPAYEPPPPEWDSGPFPKGEPHIVYFDSIDKLDAYCRSWGVNPKGRVGRSRINGCYTLQFNTIAAPDPKTWPGGQREVDQIIRHEKGHARGGVHGSKQHEWERGDWLAEWQARNSPRPAAQAPVTPADLARALGQ